MKIRIRCLKESLKQFSSTGNINAIAHKIAVVEKQGKFKDKNVLLDTLETIAENLHVKSIRGNRYKASVREFYEVILILGGPRLANFVSCNLNGPFIDSIYNWRSREIPSLNCMLTDENMKKLAQIYVKLMEKHGISKIPVLTAEDETAIKKVVSYDNKEEKLLWNENGK